MTPDAASTRDAIDVVGFGNAIVDVIATADDDFLAEEGLVKGTMRLVDEDEAGRLYDRMGPGVEVSGGSAANTMVGLASLGGRAAFVGKVCDDQMGEVFAHDLRSAGVEFETPSGSGAATARSLILVTPDAQRTMNTFLGACQALGPEDVDADLVASAAITYLEGYLWDPPGAKDAFRRAAALAHEAGRRVALTLSDSFCVDRYRDEFQALVAGAIDVLFANEAELTNLYETPDVADALAQARRACDVVAVTRGPAGSVLARGDEVVEIAAEPVDHVVDTTGAGDLYASGVLFALTRDLPLDVAGRLGSLCAAEIISHVGARPQASLRTLAEAEGLL